MVLVRPLTQEELERHEKLLRLYSRVVLDEQNPEIELIGNGEEKGIYELRTPGSRFIAAAATSRNKREKLLPEYTVLHLLHDEAGQYFPRPIGHWVPPEEGLGDMFVMERIKGLDLDEHRNQHGPLPVSFSRDLAFKLGYAAVEINAKAGRYMSDPHNGNIMVVPDGDCFDIQFVDAIQWRLGDLDDAVETILSNREDRPESYRFINEFYKGLKKGLVDHEGMNPEDVADRLRYMNEINPILTF